jgi:signal peptidase I
MNDGHMPSGNPRRQFIDARYWLRDLILSLLLAFIVIFFLYQPVQVEGTSMEPRLTHRERIFINKFAYHFEAIERGDIVVFRYPRDTSKSYIKRVVAMPGEWVSVSKGHVFINGKPLTEPYLRASFVDAGNYPAVHIGAEEYYVLGDHRESSNDSRAWGTVNREYIYGKAVFIYWPFSQLGPVE